MMADLRNKEQTWHWFLYLLLFNFLVGFFFDFSSTIFDFFIEIPMHVPSLSPIFLTIWLFLTAFIFMKILTIFGYEKMTGWLLVMYFLLLYGTGMNVVGNSVQLKLWTLGYQDHLGLGLPYSIHLHRVPSNIIPIFKLLYFYDETLGHLFLFSGYFLFFMVFYYAGFNAAMNDVLKKHYLLFYVSVILNGLYIAWLIIEGQSIILFVLFTAILLGIKGYQYKKACYTNLFGKQIEQIFIAAWFYIFLWFATVGHFKTLPQFFETMVQMLGIKV